METYNITVKCKTEEERDIVLATLDEGIANYQAETLIEQGIVRYRQDSNVYFSKNEEQHWSEKKTVII
tara:strand:- start:237 stop:440 length:204 start_codon:yes stop_codon:yes gene_type:complete